MLFDLWKIIYRLNLILFLTYIVRLWLQRMRCMVMMLLLRWDLLRYLLLGLISTLLIVMFVEIVRETWIRLCPAVATGVSFIWIGGVRRVGAVIAMRIIACMWLWTCLLIWLIRQLTIIGWGWYKHLMLFISLFLNLHLLCLCLLLCMCGVHNDHWEGKRFFLFRSSFTLQRFLVDIDIDIVFSFFVVDIVGWCILLLLILLLNN